MVTADDGTCGRVCPGGQGGNQGDLHWHALCNTCHHPRLDADVGKTWEDAGICWGRVMLALELTTIVTRHCCRTEVPGTMLQLLNR